MNSMDTVVSGKYHFLAGGGETGELIRQYPWENTPAGPVEQWPQSLKTCLRIMLTSSQPMCIWWGSGLINFYNDAYRSVLGHKHPACLGQPASVVWKENWHQIGPRAEQALLNNEGTYNEALLLIMERDGYPEETYYTFSYNPVPGENGTPEGLLCVNTDDTDRIVSARQMRTLQDLSRFNLDSKQAGDVFVNSLRALHENLYDFPFTFFYSVDKNTGVTGYTVDDLPETGFPRTADTDGNALPWPVHEAIRLNRIVQVEHLREKFGDLPKGAWEIQSDSAIVIPVVRSGTGQPYGALIVGLNPYRQLDDEYQGFFQLVAEHIAAITSSVSNINQRNRPYYRHLLQGLPAAIYTCDLEGRIQWYNDAAVALWGRKPEIGVDRWCGSWKIFNPDGITPMAPDTWPVAMVLKNGEPVRDAEIIIERPDGSRRNVQSYPDPIFEDGEVVGAVNMLIDITDLKIAQVHMGKLAAIVESSDDAIVSKTLEGIITSWNPAAERLFGYTSEEVTGKSILTLIPEERWKEEPLIMERLKKGERIDHFETERVAKNGRKIQISLTISPIKDIHGRIIGASKIARDISARKLLFQELQESEARYMQVAMEMEAIVAQRTRELTEANYYLEKSNTELEQFAFVTSHDLQEPLRKIHTFAGLLVDAGQDTLSDTAKVYIEKMMISARRMSQLIHDLLNFSRLNRTDDAFIPTDLNEVMGQVLNDFELTVSQKKAVVNIGPLPLVRAVPLQMNQLLYNLLGNALKFTAEDRTPLISISSRIVTAEDFAGYPELDTTKKYVEVRVEDNGIGFNQIYEEKIFQIFQRLNNRTAYEGTGIGLALCNKIAINHKGCIRAEGRPDEGAIFTVVLPAM